MNDMVSIRKMRSRVFESAFECGRTGVETRGSALSATAIEDFFLEGNTEILTGEQPEESYWRLMVKSAFTNLLLGPPGGLRKTNE
jgi:hypothetical protein